MVYGCLIADINPMTVHAMSFTSTIPKNIRERLGIKPNDRVDFILEDNPAVLVPVKTLKNLRGAVTPRPRSSLDEERLKAKRTLADGAKEDS